MCKHCNGETCYNSEQVRPEIDQEKIENIEEVGASSELLNVTIHFKKKLL